MRAISSSCARGTCGRRIKVLKPENRGWTSASTGSGRGPESLFGFMGANYKASRPMRLVCSGDREARRASLRRGAFLRPQDAKCFFQGRNFKHRGEMRGFEHLAEKNRWVHYLHLRRVPRRPTAHPQQGSQAARIQMVNFRNIQHQNADRFELLDPAPELVERRPAP